MSDIDSGTRHDEWLARKDEIASAFAGATTDPVVDRVVGVWLMAAGAAAVSLALLGRERGQRRPWMAPFGSLLVLAGLTVLGGSGSGRGAEQIAEAEAEIRE
jgi:hypothetical protein